MAADRIPPPGETLEFAENLQTGTVHIACSKATRAWTPVTRATVEAAQVLSLLSTPCRMMCGIKELVAPSEALRFAWISGRDFKDDALCIACVRALGDQQARAFHADNRENAPPAGGSGGQRPRLRMRLPASPGPGRTRAYLHKARRRPGPALRSAWPPAPGLTPPLAGGQERPSPRRGHRRGRSGTPPAGNGQGPPGPRLHSLARGAARYDEHWTGLPATSRPRAEGIICQPGARHPASATRPARPGLRGQSVSSGCRPTGRLAAARARRTRG